MKLISPALPSERQGDAKLFNEVRRAQLARISLATSLGRQRLLAQHAMALSQQVLADPWQNPATVSPGDDVTGLYAD